MQLGRAERLKWRGGNRTKGRDSESWELVSSRGDGPAGVASAYLGPHVTWSLLPKPRATFARFVSGEIDETANCLPHLDSHYPCLYLNRRLRHR